MKASAKNVGDDPISTEKIIEIPLSELHPFKNHPFKVKDDEAMMETADSIRQYGVLVPAIVHPREDGGYEMIAGHRRHRASELAEKDTMPAIVRMSAPMIKCKKKARKKCNNMAERRKKR